MNESKPSLAGHIADARRNLEAIRQQLNRLIYEFPEHGPMPQHGDAPNRIVTAVALRFLMDEQREADSSLEIIEKMLATEAK